ncbi:MAG: hypothetical protein A2271_04220 [Candidatus Moranbacteria bacterium RIFOXYA12_FULL_35_19]|nr:MAG: hypothetical protein UR78_C0014G0034 [Candidatus Moranbacteria bacterium GW2011_GWF2_35_39]OGI32171.1 MAG: hypothetical protein A2489_01215 [Candidatus Moranbacteria bacterium RIFOXYC12_FULL_36_13]OGI33230.1 MAG: hypothetical protein A2343_03235 [Candidatus Moranbacteria bacterium RIFOXYB12_FULL_35_8]OGI36887.1 MAG: hypothetical protein A2271_04220 [Candidatus Moranbacteria bacterium RIFOXYA12_FULL_35_19]
MKKIFFLAIFCVVFLARSVFAGDTFYADYNPATKILAIEASDFQTFEGCYDVVLIEWDRFFFSTNPFYNNLIMPEMYLVAYGVGNMRLFVRKLPISGKMSIFESIGNVPCDTKFQIEAKVYENDEIISLFWALDGSLHPLRSEFNGRNVEIVKGAVVEGKQTYVFQTTCPCQQP